MNNHEDAKTQLTPLTRVEILYQDLLQHYGAADDGDVRAAAKLLLVALDRFSSSNNPHWPELVEEYVEMAKNDREKFSRVLASNRGSTLVA